MQTYKQQKPIYDAIKEPPTPEQIKVIRNNVELTQTQMASLLGLSSNRLISEYEQGKKSPNPQTWTLFLLLTGQHPKFNLVPK